MKKFITIFFVTLGVLFFVLILLVGLFVAIDPFGLRPVVSGVLQNAVTTEREEAGEHTETGVDKNPMLTESQENALQSYGVDPSTLPTSITAEQEVCFESALGAERVAEIKAGGMPTPVEFYKAKECW